MKNFLGMLVLVVAFCFSCDGRQTKKESLQRAVSEFNLRLHPIPSDTYNPESYVEIVTDTLIANMISVRIKNYSLMDKQILISKADLDNSEHRNYQRVFESEISISTATKDIFNTRISAQQFKGFDNGPFWEQATLQHTWVNQELSSPQEITLDISLINPITAASKLYRMSINAHGQETLILIEEQS